MNAVRRRRSRQAPETSAQGRIYRNRKLTNASAAFW